MYCLVEDVKSGTVQGRSYLIFVCCGSREYGIELHSSILRDSSILCEVYSNARRRLLSHTTPSGLCPSPLAGTYPSTKLSTVSLSISKVENKVDWLPPSFIT